MAKRTRSKTEKRLFSLCGIALLCAMQIVFAKLLAIPIGDTMRFSFSFIPVVIAARYYGIVGGVLVYSLGDLIGSVALPMGGAYFPGFTVTAAVSGLLYGIFLGKECEKFWNKIFYFDKRGLIKIFLAVLSSQIICTLLMNSFWNSMLYGTHYWTVFVTRLPQAGIMSALQIAFMVLFLDKICNALRKVGV